MADQRACVGVTRRYRGRLEGAYARFRKRDADEHRSNDKNDGLDGILANRAFKFIHIYMRIYIYSLATLILARDL